jgi:hypothetical protein
MVRFMTNLAESSREGYGSKTAVLSMMIIYNLIDLFIFIELFTMN